VVAQLPDNVLAENEFARVTRADFELELERIPEEHRTAVISSPARLSGLVEALLTSKSLAAQARAAGLEKDPKVRRRIDVEVDRVLAAAWVEKQMDAASSEFDARIAQFEQRALEVYLTEPDRFGSPEQVDTSHILFKVDNRTSEMALQLANEVRATLQAGEDFAALAKVASEDAVTRTRGGRVGWRSRKDLDASYAEVAFALSEPGQVSEPVKSRFGYHVIRLERRRSSEKKSFDEVKDSILRELRQRYVADRREAFIAKIRADPSTRSNESAIEALRPVTPARPSHTR
jgi:peptidyl-prolyl cis-trans isomerase C